MPNPTDALQGLTVLERGWLSSNNLLIHAAGDEPGAVLVDTSHVNHVDQTLALVRHALQGQPLATVVNTHLHSDHCGGNAVLQREFGAALLIPPGQAEAVANWDDGQLSHQATGQRCDRFAPQGLLRPGEVLRAGGRRWEVLPAPGHDPDSVMLFDPAGGVLVSADALWEHGFGLVFPELVGEPGFDDVASVLDAIERLPVRVVVPGHGAPFSDVAAALARARSRLRNYVAEPARHARHAAKVLIKYHLMEERRQAVAALRDWTAAAPLFAALWDLHGRALTESPQAWCDALVGELVGSGALGIEDGVVVDR
ncbi:MBL fold metallo-hydrolase [Ideonella sp. A 288]|uniref:MBL fold metallo-hydrolase n=1 Tax=Ideonella sp. A 288 TaxID=1962181 RepID=UPI001F2EBBBB|nr:MBL fold metallo-hydrolase [Ideonella sp. A 288]